MRRRNGKTTSRSSIGTPLVCVLACLVLILTANQASAQPETTRVFVPPPEAADPELREALDEALPAFYRVLTVSGQVTLAADSEMEAVVSSCREQVGATPTEERRCQVQAARITAMDHVIVLYARRVGEATEVSVRALTAENAGEVFANAVLIGEDGSEAVGDAVGRLAAAYLRWLSGADRAAACFEAVRASEPSIASSDVGAVLEVLDVEPSPLSVQVDGDTVGYAPGQALGLPRGSVTVELTADGYRPQSVEVVLATEAVVTISGIALEPLPGQIVVSSNIVGVTVDVDGVAVGTLMEEPVVAQVAPGRHDVTATRSGYFPFTIQVTVLPGGEHAVDAVLAVDAPTPGPDPANPMVEVPAPAPDLATPAAAPENPREPISRPPPTLSTSGPNTAAAGWVLIGTGLAAGLGGVIYDAANIGLRDDKQDAYDTGDVAAWNRLDQEIADVRRVELITIGVGAAVTVIGLVLVLLDGSDDAAGDHASRWIGPNGAITVWRFP